MNGRTKRQSGLHIGLARAYRRITHPNGFLVRRFLRKTAQSVTEPVEYCVDVGAGTAPYRSVIEALWGVQCYLALDIAPSENTIAISDARSLPFKSDSIDQIVSFDVIQHIEKTDFVLDELYRVLRPGGVVILSFPFMYSECDFRDYYRWTIAGMSAELARRGFRIVDARRRGGLLYMLASFLIWFVQHLLPGGRAGWRSRRSLWTYCRFIATSILTLPIIPIAWAALFLDSLLPDSDAYMGAMIVARK